MQESRTSNIQNAIHSVEFDEEMVDNVRRSQENNQTNNNEHDNGNTNGNYGFWVAVSFTLNYIIGSGFLTLPWAFHKSGIFLGLLIMTVFAVFSVLSVLFTLETMERAKNMYKNARKSNGSRDYMEIPLGSSHSPIIEMNNQNQTQNDTIQNNIEENNNDDNDNNENDDDDEIIFNDSIITNNDINHSLRKYEFSELCKLFLGNYGQMIYAVSISIYLYGTLWAYSTVFAKAFSTHMPLQLYKDLIQQQEIDYVLYLLLFSVLVVPLSLMEFHEQIFIQVMLTIFRVIMVSLMIITVVIAYIKNDIEFYNNSNTNNNNNISNVDNHSLIYGMNFQNAYFLLPIAGYAYIFHHSIPSLAHPVQDKKSLPKIFSYAIYISFVAYSLVGGVLSLYFGNHIQVSSNLNWETYLGYAQSYGGVLFAKFVSFFVVLFPALDVASAFPLNAFTLGNNLMSTWYGNDMHKYEKSRMRLSFFRSLAAIPPIFAAYAISDLGVITDYTGLSGFIIAFIFPALLSKFSKLRLESFGISSNTIYTSWKTGPIYQNILAGSGIILLFYKT
eukprot:gene8822-11911_t